MGGTRMRMIEKIKRKLKEKSGMSAYISIAVVVIVVVMLLVTNVTFLGIYAKYNQVNAMAHEIARYVEIKGQVNSDTYAEFERLRDAAGFTSAEVSFSRSGKIPLEDAFTVTVVVKSKFGVGGIQVIPVNVTAVASGRSEVYWK